MNGNGKSGQGAVEVLGGRCASGPLSYRDFIDCALYHPEHGYYRQARRRVGRAPETDFYTAESLGPVFARLVAAAAVQLLGPDVAAASCFVEIGAEPGSSLVDALPETPFASARTFRRGDPLRLEGRCVVFANEWLDALPFHRLVFQDGAWRERGVRTGHGGKLEETLLHNLTPSVAEIATRLPAEAPEGYELDLPLDAEKALQELLRQDWTGLLLIFDYGKSWATLAGDTPQGTARSFRRHRKGADLLEEPGNRDITCDLCWDWLEDVLVGAGLRGVALESQEAFFVHHAAAAAESIVKASAGAFSRDRQTLMELIHPSHMGARFQVLFGCRA
jgi:SAM-dependent MidA family methyltransferase